MLEVAKLKAPKHNLKTEYFFNDMRKLDFNEEYDLVFSVNQVIAHCLTNSDVCDYFKSIRNSLKKDGIFVFDFCSFSQASTGINKESAQDEEFNF